MGLLLLILGIVLIVAGVFALIRGQLLWGAVLVIVGLVVAPSNLVLGL
ncbi:MULTISPECIES: GPGG-motif small membrane protein [Nocardiopsis]|uniref:GPGG-motif small membrane protein n=2 Tax=Nocardiopsis TaxID=2013 RepID=A0ABT4TJZ1_9ACTN|nr:MULTISPECIES: GPGG-motif small membrane protein [Nocardiopsis]MDA2805023.1 GPGG-motif small membrane protein [Nocardiopsis suaedae]MDA2812720.1 GPGG-motif small membrane protein [Nocardiopsis endophytica]